MSEEFQLKIMCALCSGSGKTSRIGFSSPAHMDSGSAPARIVRSCDPCKGRGWIYPATEDLVTEIERLRGENSAAYDNGVEDSATILEASLKIACIANGQDADGITELCNAIRALKGGKQ